MFKVVGGDFKGFRMNCHFGKITLSKGRNEVVVTRADIDKVEVIDSQSNRSGARMVVKGAVYSAIGLNGMVGALSAKNKVDILLGITLTSGRTFLVETDDDGYRKIMKIAY